MKSADNFAVILLTVTQTNTQTRL